MNTFQTEAEYLEARRMHDENHAASSAYRKLHNTTGIPVFITETFPYAKEVNNDLKTKIEVWEFIHKKPEKYFLYIREKTCTAVNWTGENLGRVIMGVQFRSNMGDVRVPVTVFGINGITYYGTYYKSSGDYARVKAKKNK